MKKYFNCLCPMAVPLVTLTRYSCKRNIGLSDQQVSEMFIACSWKKNFVLNLNFFWKFCEIKCWFSELYISKAEQWQRNFFLTKHIKFTIFKFFFFLLFFTLVSQISISVIKRISNYMRIKSKNSIFRDDEDFSTYYLFTFYSIYPLRSSETFDVRRYDVVLAAYMFSTK